MGDGAARTGEGNGCAGQARVPENTYVLEAGGLTVFFGGDTFLIPELGEVAERFPNIDLALVAVNGLKIRPMLNRQEVMNAREAAELVKDLSPALRYRSTTALPVARWPTACS